MLTKIMFRTCTVMLLFNLIACVPDDSLVPSIEPDAQYATYDVDDSQPPVSAIPVPYNPVLLVSIQASDCILDGATLLATNPSLPGNPAFTQENYAVKWYKNNQLIATGAQLSDCICGEKIVVKVENTNNGIKGSATYNAKPCKAQSEADKF